MFFTDVANLQLMFPDAPVQELELIVKDSPDFDQALEVVLHRFGRSGEAPEFPNSTGMSGILSFLQNRN